MRILRHTLVGASLTGALMFAASTAPTHATEPVSKPVTTAQNGPTGARLWFSSTGGWVKSCKESTCGKVEYVPDGGRLWSTHYENNRFGNRWYQVVTDADNNGWIWCGNTDAECED
ncbi:hypothetical protein [Streptomyces milbemycinicus]|uniref:Secreted protein n=1 Tax=Streptomyces milbemycinicus TaxID=476552 RepID=A0ABW8LRH5_9ACTN